MKILQVFNQYRFKGGEEAWVDAIPGLVGEDAEVEDLRFHSTDWIDEQRPSLISQVLRMADNPDSRAALRNHAERFKPDVLLFHNVIPVASFGLYFEAKSLGIPVFQYIHNFRPFSPGGTLWTGQAVLDHALYGNPWPEIISGSWQGSKLKTAILSYHLKMAVRRGLLDCIDRWISPSHFMRDKFVSAGIPINKIDILRHCWNAEVSTETAPEGEHYLFLGRLVSEKGTTTLIKAWQIMEEKLGAACPRLVIAGSGPEEEFIRQQASSMQRVECAGFVSGDKKQRLIQGCRAMLIPSICWESLGLTAYEGYSASRPVIAARSGALQETVHEGVTGWTHLADDPADLARALMSAEEAGAGERARRGQAGRDWMVEHAHPAHWKRDFLDICRRATSPRPTTPAKTRPLQCQVYLADQNPGYDRSYGISRMSLAMMQALQLTGDTEITAITSKTSQTPPDTVSGVRKMPWATRNKWARLLTDHLHPLLNYSGVYTDVYYYPKGFLPWVSLYCRPSVVTIHDTIIQYQEDHYPQSRKSWEYNYWAKMLRHTLENADSILTVSESSKSQIEAFMKRYDIPTKPIIVTYEPCAYELIPQPEHPDKDNYYLHLASTEPHKQTALLIDWWIKEEQSGRILPELHLVGSLPAETRKLVDKSTTLVKRPFLEDSALQQAYRRAKALIIPSEIEGFGLPALEAYYLGTPVCFVKGTSVDEILSPATSKGAFDLNNRESLFRAIDEVGQMSPGEIHDCGMTLRQTYNSSKVAERMIRAFRNAACDWSTTSQ